LSEVFGVVISLLRMATALKNLEAPFTSYGFWVDMVYYVYDHVVHSMLSEPQFSYLSLQCSDTGVL